MAYRIEVAVDDCMSSGKCIGDYPKTFDFDDEELAMLIDDGQKLSDEDMIRAARNCPSQALRVIDSDGTIVTT